jgi:hypothetical protein
MSEPESFMTRIARLFRRRTGSWDKQITIHPALTPAALDALYGQVYDKLTDDMAFLRSPVRWRRLVANLVKLAALLLFAAGLLLPILLVEEASYFGLPPRSGAELALAAIVAGGLILLADQLFNLSRSWQRLMLAELQVKSVRQALAMEWQKRRPFVADSAMATEGVAMIELLASALKENHQVMLTQKQAWATELDQALTELRGRFESQRGALEKTVAAQKEEEARPTTGALNIAIDKPGDLTGEVVLLVDGKEARKWPAPDAALSVGNVPAGLRVVELTAKRKAPAGADFTFAQSVKVDGGAVAAFQVKVG